jgi:hypothetical protein
MKDMIKAAFWLIFSYAMFKLSVAFFALSKILDSLNK